MAKITAVSIYEFYGTEWADVMYESGRLYYHPVKELPKTVTDWLVGKTGATWYNRTLERNVTTYREVQ